LLGVAGCGGEREAESATRATQPGLVFVFQDV
jgi:hypothetical protein